MTTDPVQEARDEMLVEIAAEVAQHYIEGTGPYERAMRYLTECMDEYAAAIRREEAARVLPVLRSMYQPALEFRCEDDSYGWHCTTCGVGILDAHEEWCAYGPVAAEITRLEALVKEGEDG